MRTYIYLFIVCILSSNASAADSPVAALSMDDLLQALKQQQSALQKVAYVNRFFNQLQWVEDKELWQQDDYWATPDESLTKKAGDCEDFAIAKYFSLLDAGIAVEQLKISYVRIRESQQSHVVLAYYGADKSDPWILDNINPQLLPLSKRQDLQMKYEFNHQGIWLHHLPDKKMGDVNRIKHWADMIKRMQQDSAVYESDSGKDK